MKKREVVKVLASISVVGAGFVFAQAQDDSAVKTKENKSEDVKSKVVRQVPQKRTPPPRPAPPTLENMDKDKDGNVSEKEFIAFHTQRLTKFFEALDSDDDAKLSKQELAKIQRRTSAAPPQPTKMKPTAQPKPKATE